MEAQTAGNMCLNCFIHNSLCLDLLKPKFLSHFGASNISKKFYFGINCYHSNNVSLATKLFAQDSRESLVNGFVSNYDTWYNVDSQNSQFLTFSWPSCIHIFGYHGDIVAMVANHLNWLFCESTFCQSIIVGYKSVNKSFPGVLRK